LRYLDGVNLPNALSLHLGALESRPLHITRV